MIENEKIESAKYEAPAVEAVLTSGELDREVHYAGFLTFIPIDTDGQSY